MKKSEMKKRIAELESELSKVTDDAYRMGNAIDSIVRYVENTHKMYEILGRVNGDEGYTLSHDNGGWESFLKDRAREEAHSAECDAQTIERVLRYIKAKTREFYDDEQ